MRRDDNIFYDTDATCMIIDIINKWVESHDK